MPEDKWKFGLMLANLKEAKVNMPKKLAATGQLYFQQNFNKAQWDGVPWEGRKKETKKSSGKALLVSSGRLRQAMQKTVRECNWNRIVWGIDVPYAKYLNNGFDGTVSAHMRTATVTRRVKGGYSGLTASFRMKTGAAKIQLRGATHEVKAHRMVLPARQFMGFNEELRKILHKKIREEFGKILFKGKK